MDLVRQKLIAACRARGPIIVSVLVAGLILADLTRFEESVRSLTTPVQHATSSVRQARPLEVQAILHAHLFGEVPETRAGTAPASSPQWLLTGVIATGDPDSGYAILSATGQGSHLWRAGTMLPGGARLEQVRADEALLEVDGKPVTLTLHGRAVRAPPPGLYAAQAAPLPPAAPPEPIVAVADKPLPEDHAALVQNPAVRWFEAIPTEPQGGGAGVLLRPPPLLGRRAGLRNGDVLTAIDGRPVTDGASVTAALQHVSGGLMTLTVNRGGEQELVTVPVGN